MLTLDYSKSLKVPSAILLYSLTNSKHIMATYLKWPDSYYMIKSLFNKSTMFMLMKCTMFIPQEWKGMGFQLFNPLGDHLPRSKCIFPKEHPGRHCPQPYHHIYLRLSMKSCPYPHLADSYSYQSTYQTSRVWFTLLSVVSTTFEILTASFQGHFTPLCDSQNFWLCMTTNWKWTMHWIIWIAISHQNFSHSVYANIVTVTCLSSISMKHSWVFLILMGQHSFSMRHLVQGSWSQWNLFNWSSWALWAMHQTKSDVLGVVWDIPL